MRLPVAVDAMGGDHAPGAVVAGACLAAQAGVPVVLVGRPDVLGEAGGLPVRAASEVVAMGDDPAQAVRRKKDSSIVRAAELVRDGEASAMVSAGNTGAAMAAALLRMGRIKGVSRPAIATPLPVPGGGLTILLDAGANSECQAEWLVQFAQMGSVFASRRFGIVDPRVGLLTIGEEPGKGNTLAKQAHELLGFAAGVNFVGNVEGRDVLSDAVDIVVTDGFTGNVVLKTLEGALPAILGGLRHAVGAVPDLLPDGPDGLRRVIDDYQASLEPENFGGAMLLGVSGVCIISHGSSNDRAIANAVRVAADLVERDLVGALRSAIAPG